jgi:hypothetical protein
MPVIDRKPDDEKFNDTLKRMLQTPPKPNVTIKKTKPRKRTPKKANPPPA